MGAVRGDVPIGATRRPDVWRLLASNIPCVVLRSSREPVERWKVKEVFREASEVQGREG